MESDLPMSSATPTELNTLLNRLLDEAEEKEGGQSPSPTTEEPAPSSPAVSASVRTPPSGGGASPLGALLANPALLTALPTLAENIGPLLGSLAGGPGGAPAVTRPHFIDRHTALLCAVKPYLSPQRREAAETVIRICRVWDALERSGISLTGLLSSLSGGGEGGSASASSGGEVSV